MKATAHLHDILNGVEWRLYRVSPGSVTKPSELAVTEPYASASVPGTVCGDLFGEVDSLHHLPIDVDEYDWFYQCDVDFVESSTPFLLASDGLATLARIYVNEDLVLESDNMFQQHRKLLADVRSGPATLTLAFHSLSHALKVRRPRGRWKTNLVSAQQLRWFRTTLLGRIPGWTPNVPAVGPWRGLAIYRGGPFVENLTLRPALAGDDGIVYISVQLRSDDPEVSSLSLQIAGQQFELPLDEIDGVLRCTLELTLPDVDPWLPHTDGTPALYEYDLQYRNQGQNVSLRTGKIGFRSTELVRSDSETALVVNGRKVFCRGFCWTTNDILTLDGDPDKLRSSLEAARDAGANMIRVGGTMVYESDLFYELCDELGLLVWQDFMFANMDYPSDDDDFVVSAVHEIEQQAARLAEHPAVVCFCGSSEVEQQAAMFGRTAEEWTNALFYEHIPAALNQHSPGVPYVESSPTGGALPFHNRSGVGHYFGIGAYKRPLNDADSSGLLFASECLGFSNMPDSASRKAAFGSATPAPLSPEWKYGVPRDSSTSWDFEDIRDHYLELLYGVRAHILRQTDPGRYYEVSEVVSGDVMRDTFGRWMHPSNPCQGGIVWFLKDLVPGAGWGTLDHANNRKPLFYALRQAWNPIGIAFRDLGLDGLSLFVRNETDEPKAFSIRLQVLQHSQILLRDTQFDVEVAARSTKDCGIDAILGQFFDTTYSYRFGAPKHDVVVASLRTTEGVALATATYYPNGHGIDPVATAQIEVDTNQDGDGFFLSITSDTFLQSTKLESRGYRFDDNYFCVAPNTPVIVAARPDGAEERAIKGSLSALNLRQGISFK